MDMVYLMSDEVQWFEIAYEECIMSGPKAETIELTETQETMLEQLVRREKRCQQLVRRSHIILAANQGTVLDVNRP